MNAEPVLRRATTAAPPSTASCTHCSSFAADSTSRAGRPLIVAVESTGTISAPWLPSAMAHTSAGCTPAASARALRKRLESSVPAMPITWWSGSPLARHSSWVISSTGLVTTMTTAAGACAPIASATSRTTRPLISSSSSAIPVIAVRCAVVVPTIPLPTNVTLVNRVGVMPRRGSGARQHGDLFSSSRWIAREGSMPGTAAGGSSCRSSTPELSATSIA
jgi:hypothetical protein